MAYQLRLATNSSRQQLRTSSRRHEIAAYHGRVTELQRAHDDGERSFQAFAYGSMLVHKLHSAVDVRSDELSHIRNWGTHIMYMQLKALNEGKRGRRLSITTTEFLIGRSSKCHLRLSSNLVSRRHCLILQHAGHVFIEDCGSMNGTFVNGQRIKDRQELRNGDHLAIGPMEFQVSPVRVNLFREEASGASDNQPLEYNDSFTLTIDPKQPHESQRH